VLAEGVYNSLGCRFCRDHRGPFGEDGLP
jgi:hypothetical protein